MTNKINGIDVSKCCYFIDHTPPKGQGDWCGAIHKGACKVYSKDCEYNKDCYFKQLKRLQQELDIKEKMLDKFMIGSGETLEKLQEENEKIKKQYNCYACGNCNGKEDYINLEKHHKGLRKQFDELAQRNNTLSLRIEELEKENDELKRENEQLKNPCLVMPKVNQLAVPIDKYEKLYKVLKEIREKCLKMCNVCDNINGETYLDDCNSICEYCKIIDLINEVLNDRD